MTDTQPAAGADMPLPQPSSLLDKIKGFIGDLARPFAIYVTSSAAAAATVIIALKNDDGFSAAAIFIGAVYAGVGTQFIGRAWENAQVAKQSANVQVAQAQQQVAP